MVFCHLNCFSSVIRLFGEHHTAEIIDCVAECVIKQQGGIKPPEDSHNHTLLPCDCNWERSRSSPRPDWLRGRPSTARG